MSHYQKQELNNIQENKELHIIFFSGGKDSTAMLFMMLENNMQIDEIINVDTTKELPGMYEHINQCRDILRKKYDKDIVILKFDFDYWFSEHIKKKGKSKGEKGYGWPDMKNRWCTGLQRNMMWKHLKQCRKEGYRIIEYHGIAYDEKKRIKKNRESYRIIKYPLYDFRITGEQAKEYCLRKGFYKNKLYNHFDRISCYCCPLKKIKELRTIYNEYPEIWEKIREMDKKSRRRFRKEYSFTELDKRFKREKENKDPDIFGLY